MNGSGQPQTAAICFILQHLQEFSGNQDTALKVPQVELNGHCFIY